MDGGQFESQDTQSIKGARTCKTKLQILNVKT